MAKVSNKELLEIAQNEATSPEQLSKIWNNTRSVKVRKAVASNPNANALTLRQAARLYIEEVVENPGFEMLKLFDDDEWIKRIGEVYDNPEAWSRGHYFARRTDQLEPFARVALLSKELHAIHLNSVLEFLPITSLKRSFKTNTTRQKARGLFAKNPRDFSLEATFKAYGSGVLSEEELYEFLKHVSYVGSLSCRKSIYVRTIKALFKAFDQEVESAPKTLAMVLLISRSSCIRWVEYLFQQKHLPVIASAMLTAKKIKKQAGHGVSTACKTTIHMLSGMITGILWEPLSFEQRKRSLGVLYKNLCQLRLEGHEWGNTKKTWGAIQLSGDLCEELLKEDIKTQVFYVRSKSLGNWFHVQKSSAKYQIVENVNSWLYERGGFENLLYNEISLKKIVTISDDVVIAY
mgnify:CR=1 FL=1|jgi:hypothetical protein|tara:strand:- start:1159 stop:2373 length:1215 start_codon:yes stop_codon:yes gene_type:complete